MRSNVKTINKRRSTGADNLTLQVSNTPALHFPPRRHRNQSLYPHGLNVMIYSALVLAYMSAQKGKGGL